MSPFSLAHDFAQLYLNPSFTDVTVVVRGRQYPAHACVLAARSGYFGTTLARCNAETTPSIAGDEGVVPGRCVVEVEGIETAEEFEIILRWMYTDEIILPPLLETSIEKSKAWRLFRVSDFLCISSLVALLEGHIISLLTVDNVCRFWNHLYPLETPRLKEACGKIFRSELFSVSKTDGFLELDRRILLEVFYGKDRTDPPRLATRFSAESMPYRMVALSRWFAARDPDRLKRKLDESFAKVVVAKKSRKLIPTTPN